MIHIYHHMVDENGVTWGHHSVDTDDPIVQDTLRRLGDGSLSADTSGWNMPSAHPDHVGRTQLQALIHIGHAANDPLIQKHFAKPSEGLAGSASPTKPQP